MLGDNRALDISKGHAGCNGLCGQLSFGNRSVHWK
nr:MAG TPA: hypothetical protein [Caudoviricetes sp.]